MSVTTAYEHSALNADKTCLEKMRLRRLVRWSRVMALDMKNRR